MMENGKQRKRRQLTPEEKWEICAAVRAGCSRRNEHASWGCQKVCVRQERMEPHAFNTTREDPFPASLL